MIGIAKINVKVPSFLFTLANQAHLQAHVYAVCRDAVLVLFVAAVNTVVVSVSRVACDESRRVNWRK